LGVIVTNAVKQESEKRVVMDAVKGVHWKCYQNKRTTWGG